MTLFTGPTIMGAAMLPQDVWCGGPFGTGNQWPIMCTPGGKKINRYAIVLIQCMYFDNPEDVEIYWHFPRYPDK